MLEIIVFIVVGYLPLCVLGIASPLIARRSICFGVSIPESYIQDKRLTAAKKNYKLWGIIVSIAGLVPLFFYNPSHVNARFEFFVLGIISFIIVVQGILYLVFHQKVKRIKQEQGWLSQPAQSGKVVIDTSFHQRKKTYSNAWYLLHLAIVLLTAGYLVSIYDSIPDVMATHYDFQGNADGFSNKSFASVFDLTFMQIGMIALFILCNWFTATSKQQTDPKNPQQSLARNIQFRRLTSLFLIVLGLMIIVMFSVLKLGSVLEWGSTFIGVSTTSFLIVMFAVIAFFIVRMLKVKRQPFAEETTELPMDADHYWKLGSFYYNPSDPAIFVEKRYGIGYTLNMGRPLGWIVLIAPLVLIGVITWIVNLAS